MTHRLVAQARPHWSSAILSRGLHVCVLSSPICPAGSSKRLIASLSRTYASHSHVGAPPEFPRSSKPRSAGPSDRASKPSKFSTVVPSSTHAPESPTPPKVASSSECTSGPPGPEQKTGSSMHTVASESPKPKTEKNQSPEILVFHNPTSKASLSMLSLLQQAQKAFRSTGRRTAPPLDFKLTVLERLPTVTELQDMYCLCNDGSWTVFHANHTASSYRIHPTSARSLLEGIEYARKAEVAKAKQNARQDPYGAVVTQAPSTDSLGSESSTTELADTSAVPNIDHPLFGTHIFSWPVVVCWRTKDVFAGANAKQVNRLLKDLANVRDGIVIKTKEQLQEEERKARQASWTYPKKEVTPDEEETLKWFNESSKKPVKKLSW